jgi:hypothetical protein
MHVHQGMMENIPFFYPPRIPGKYPKPLGVVGGGAKVVKPPAEEDDDEAPEPTVAPPKNCPLWAVRNLHHLPPPPSPSDPLFSLAFPHDRCLAVPSTRPRRRRPALPSCP